MITVTKGQWFPLTIGNISYGGAAFDLQGATEVSASLVSTLGVRSPLNFEVTAYNELSAVSDGSLSAGTYAIEVSCKGADGKSYRMKSPSAVIEVSSSTTPSTGTTSVRVAGDEWELTADVEMHEGQARTYMSLLEEARKAAIKAADDAEAVIDNVQSSVTQAQEAVNTAQKASANAEDAVTKANNAVSDANNALQSITTMESTVSAAEQGRKDAESERVTAEQGREKEMSDYMLVIKKPIVTTSTPIVHLDPNKFYVLGFTDANNLNINLNAPTDETITNDYEGCFDTDAVAPTVVWPSGVVWGNTIMSIYANTHYEFSIRYSSGIYYGVIYNFTKTVN